MRTPLLKEIEIALGNALYWVDQPRGKTHAKDLMLDAYDTLIVAINFCENSKNTHEGLQRDLVIVNELIGE